MSTSRDLYPQLMGETWAKLSAAIRLAHVPGTEKRGRFRVTHGSSFVARGLIRLSRLPQAANDAEVFLTIHPHQGTERWERRIGCDSFVTVQWASGGHLVERFQNWELRFVLRVSDAALEYEQRGARLRVGPLRLPVPLAFAPRVRAREEASGPDRVQVHVSVSLPWIGPLITYDGHLGVEESLL